MSAADLVRVLTSALFVLIFVSVAVNAVRHPRRANVDAALLFGSLGIAVALSELRALGLEAIPALSMVSGALVVAMPYLLLRLVDDFAEVARPVTAVALAGFALSASALVFLPAPLPAPITLGIVLYWLAFGSYAAWAFAREARRTSGATRQRMRAAAAGSLGLGLALLAAGLGAVFPGALAPALTRVLALVSALSYVAAFAPPALLRRAWHEPELRGFLTRVAAASPLTDPWAIVAALEEAARRALGAPAAAIGLWDDSAAALRYRDGDGLPPPEAVSGRAFAEGRAIFSTDVSREDPRSAARRASTGVQAVLAAPITIRGASLGVLSVRARRAPIFAEDDLALVRLLADQAAIVLAGARQHADLQAVNERLASATRAKSEFLANMSHELRTPLNAILGFSELLDEQIGDTLTGAQRRYLANIRDAGEHLLELVNEVLDLSKVEAGRLELHPEVVRLGTLLAPAVSSTRAAAEARQIGFEVAVPADVLVRVDPGRVRQVLYNLLSNAVKFTSEGGRVRLEARTEGTSLVVEVSDTGIGIPAAERHRVFRTFERLHVGRVEAEGTGLGLALTRRIVELHRGTIDFESEEGRGTRFRVCLPDVAVEALGPDRVLVVEDVPSDADLIASVASEAGMRSEVVATASSALEAVRRAPPRGIVLDLRLPDERGERVLEALKADPATRQVPVIVVSVEDDVGRSRPLGADDHLTKPIDRPRLAAWLRRLAEVSEGSRAHPAR